MRNTLLVAIIAAMALAGPALAVDVGDKKKDAAKKSRPPAVVNVAEARAGEVQPMVEFVGTVFYSQVSKVASEVSGRVEEVVFEEGRRAREGDVLVRLNSEMLETSISGTQAKLDGVLIEIERARKDLKRIENLYRDESVAESVYDEYSFKVKGLRKQADSLKAELDRQRLELDRKAIKAPFGGVVIEKSVEKGEWVSPGGKVMVLARDTEVDVVVDVPEGVLRHIKKGLKVAVSSGGAELTGRLNTIVPRGDIATRTFRIKIRLRNRSGLMEGMEARVKLPSGARIKGLLMPRDAVISKFGRMVVFLFVDGKAKMVPVKVMGYHGGEVGVAGPGLEPGVKVVVKGNERISDGQSLKALGK